MTAGPIIELAGVGKTFVDPRRGPVHAIDGISAAIADGILVILGANGAGKSTLLRLLAGLLLPDRGRVRVCGHDTRQAGTAVRAHLGYLSLTTQVYPRLTGREMLAYAGRFHDLEGASLAERIASMSETFALQAFIDQRCDSMSTGQKQRINLARTLLADPDVLILDEPTTGLDLVAARIMVEAVAAMRRPGRCIVFCTHLLHEARSLADRMLVLRRGRVAYDGSPHDLAGEEGFARCIEELVHDHDLAEAP